MMPPDRRPRSADAVRRSLGVAQRLGASPRRQVAGRRARRMSMPSHEVARGRRALSTPAIPGRRRWSPSSAARHLRDASRTAAGSRPIGRHADERRVAPSCSTVEIRRSCRHPGRQQPASAISAASGDPARFWPPRRSVGRRRRTVGGSLVAPTSGTYGSSRRDAGGRGGLGREQRPDGPDRRLEAVEPLAHRRERDARSGRARPRASRHPRPTMNRPPVDVVEHGRCLRQDRSDGGTCSTARRARSTIRDVVGKRRHRRSAPPSSCRRGPGRCR